ncbi:MAG: hypothetical protein EB015_15470 [Methylocystaceae bacterium]|nr:hypothetical protein [Methylocystaceae bacterium]
MLTITREQYVQIALGTFVRQIAVMLRNSESVPIPIDDEVLCSWVAHALDEAWSHGVRTQRLLGMCALLRIVDGIDPYTISDYKAVISSTELAEDDKAHLLQMIRIGEAGFGSEIAV